MRQDDALSGFLCGENGDNKEMLFTLLFPLTIFALQDYLAERDPPAPEAKKQYRLFLRTPARDCAGWRKVSPVLDKRDMVISESKRDEGGKTPGCRFLWVIHPEEAPGATRFEMETMTGGRESFELPSPAGYRAREAAPAASSASRGMLGVANENGSGPATVPVRGRVSLPAAVGVEGARSADPGTGK